MREFTELYFKQIFSLFPEDLRPEARKKFKAYEVLSWKVYRALIKAELEPNLGFLHSE